ncbi:adenylate kinase isoenzyme 1-like [Arvicola amphibius]|uniref:adenylate kinase isoenzyme 1-like n=1 Tax=Arvicola amphibius TaxID=1047088 RepID=UPI0018E3042B|nr:adenylate kinase isoenzyme 1-like [Arvicola amphibius]XP_038180771.1 adenylate kinase isoenzyme 1-like [Arvicola amphibius]
MATKYGFCHVGLGQLLREEAQRSTKRGRKIRDIMQQGLLVPTGLILDMVSDSLLSCPESSGFLIDGFPRELEQAKEFERIVGRAPNAVMVFDCSMETMVRRVLRRGQVEHRADDSESTIRKRLETYYTLAPIDVSHWMCLAPESYNGVPMLHLCSHEALMLPIRLAQHRGVR